jgi:hypothetical protein
MARVRSRLGPLDVELAYFHELGAGDDDVEASFGPSVVPSMRCATLTNVRHGTIPRRRGKYNHRRYRSLRPVALPPAHQGKVQVAAVAGSPRQRPGPNCFVKMCGISSTFLSAVTDFLPCKDRQVVVEKYYA